MSAPRILVSACLLGQKLRYDGGDKYLADRWLDRWQAENRLIPFCPEIAGGLSAPRPAAEIDPARGRVWTRDGTDVTAAFQAGAVLALALARREECRFALLTDGSPSCGSGFVYDGQFTGTRIAGAGITAAWLRQHGVQVFAPDAIPALAAALGD